MAKIRRDFKITDRKLLATIQPFGGGIAAEFARLKAEMVAFAEENDMKAGEITWTITAEAEARS